MREKQRRGYIERKVDANTGYGVVEGKRFYPNSHGKKGRGGGGGNKGEPDG